MKVVTVIGQTYALRSKSGGNLTNEAGDVLETLEPGVQLHVTAQEPAWVLPEDCQVTACRTFKSAALALDLLGGGDKSGLPRGYTRIEYLESTGTQYIDTNIKATGAMNVVFSFVLVSDSYTNYVFGANGRDNTTNRLEFSPRYGYSNASGVFRYGETVSYIGIAYKFGVKENYEIVRAHVYRNGKEVSYSTIVPQQAFTSNFSILVFGSRNGNNSNVEAEGGKRIYNIAIADEGVPLVNYIPALDPTGAPCMYDTVTRKPFYNSGTGDFLYPGKETQATTYSLRRPRMYAQMTAHGIRRLYHVPRGYNGTPEEYAEQNGFKLLVETPAPEEGNWAPVWHEREDCIELEWVETEPEMESEMETVDA